MHRYQIVLSLCALALASQSSAADFSGTRALEYTRRAVAFGPRPPGSPAIQKLQAFIVGEMKQRGCELQLDDFTGQTPHGPIAMKNVLCRFKGQNSNRAVVISGHYDTKYFKDVKFVGADDGGSSTGFLLEFARALQGRSLPNDVYLVFLDGEEAFGQWSATDSLYGSRHLAAKWAASGMLGRIKALINVDMIGDKNLDILQEQNSTSWLRNLVWKVAQDNGYGKYFLPDGGPTEDDHMPFLQKGVAALDLIDFNYPPWHTADDTMDKLGAHSFEVVGNVLLKVLVALGERP